MKKYIKQLKREVKDAKSQLEKRTYISIAATLVFTGAVVASACGAVGNLV